MLQTLKTARHLERQKQRRGAGTGPKHARPVTPRQRMARAIDLPGVVRAYNYHSADPAAGRQPDETLHDQSQPEANDQKTNRPSRRALKAAAYIAAAVLPVGLAADATAIHARSEANPAAASQAAIARQAGMLANELYAAYDNIAEGGNGVDSQQGKSIAASVRLATGETETVRLESAGIVPSSDGTSYYPDPARINNVSTKRLGPNRSSVTTTYTLKKDGQWNVSQEVHYPGHDARAELRTEDGEAFVQTTDLSSNGTAEMVNRTSAPNRVDEYAANMAAEADWEMGQLVQVTQSLPSDSVTLM